MDKKFDSGQLLRQITSIGRDKKHKEDRNLEVLAQLSESDSAG